MDGKVLAHLRHTSKVVPETLNDLSTWGNLHIKPTAGCKILTLIFLLIFHYNLPTDSKVRAHLGFMSKVLPGPLTDLSAWIAFCNSSSQQGVKYQLSYLD